MYRLDCKCMLKKEDEFILGEGRKKLLQLISKTGSIKDAAEEMDMSYRHAWGIIKKIEKGVGKKVVVSKRGGQRGGGTRLSKFGREMLDIYEDMKKEHRGDVYLNPALTVDGIIEIDEEILLIKRKNDPFKDKYALPGGFVEYNEEVEKAVVREITEETGLETEIKKLVGVYSKPDRDPRGHTVSVVYSLSIIGGSLSSGSDAKEAKYFSTDELPELSFDHEKIIKDYLLLSRD